jgi:siroheme synthase
MENGLAGETPCVVVSRATRSEQLMRRSTIGALSDEDRLPAPALLLAGRVSAELLDNWKSGLRPDWLVEDQRPGFRAEESRSQ